MVSTRGPVPKREDDRLGNAHRAKDVDPVEKIEFTAELRPMPEDEYWEPVAKYAYQAFLDSPLNKYYSETDIAFGWMTANAINDAATGAGSAMKTSAAESMMKSALFTEGDRRRVRIELTRKEPDRNPVADKNVADFQARRAQRRSG